MVLDVSVQSNLCCLLLQKVQCLLAFLSIMPQPPEPHVEPACRTLIKGTGNFQELPATATENTKVPKGEINSSAKSLQV